MKRRKTRTLAILTAALLLSVMTISCGGGGGTSGDDGGGDPNLTAVFVGDTAGDLGMTAGDASGGEFEIEFMASGIANLSGAAFHVYFDHTSAALTGWSGDGAIFGTGGDYRASVVALGEIAVSAALPDDGAGIDGTGLLITLSFRATQGTAENRFTFGTDVPVDTFRRVKICPDAQGCTNEVPDSWTGGTLMVTQ